MEEEVDEISIDIGKEKLVEDVADKVEEQFDVVLAKGTKSGDKRWIVVYGKPEDRKAARDYLKTLCNPGEVMPMNYPEDLHMIMTNPKILSKLEAQSKTAIQIKKLGQLNIHAVDSLGVALAMSALEDLINKNVSEGAQSIPDLPNPKSTPSRQSSARLDMELQKISLEDKDIVYDEDYTSLTDSVKRTLLGWYQEDKEKRKSDDGSHKTHTVTASEASQHRPYLDKIAPEGANKDPDDDLEKMKQKNKERQNLLRESFNKQMQEDAELPPKKTGNNPYPLPAPLRTNPANNMPAERGNPANNVPRQPGPKGQPRNGRQLRPIVIDGSNIAMVHANGKYFSCKGIQICINYFQQRGHKEITAFVPQWRTQKPTAAYPIQDQHLLAQLKINETVVLTPARNLPGIRIACHDDNFVVRLAKINDGIVVTNDNYRDLWKDRSDWQDVIENRLLPFAFVGDIFMPPDDPLGRNGPHLDDFLCKPEQ